MTGEKKVLDHGYVRYVEHWGSDQRIIESARMSVDKGFLGWGEESDCTRCSSSGSESGFGPGHLCRCCWGKKRCVEKPGDEKLLRFLWENKHATPFEMAGLTIEVQAPIFVFREWHRHRTQSYSEMSARYTPLPDVNYVPSIARLMANAGTSNKQAGTIKGAAALTLEEAEAFQSELRVQYADAQINYEHWLEVGVPKELARVALPVGRYSRMRASTDLRNWIGFLTLRMEKSAQWEIRVYAEALHDFLKQCFPRTMVLFDGQ